MDTICVYKDKLNEALTLVPSMSQAKKLEAVSYWNNAATHFQQIVNANSPTQDLARHQNDATGQDSSLDLDYHQQASDINPTVILNSEEFVNAPCEQVNPSINTNIVDLSSDLSPSTNASTGQFQRQATLSDAGLYDTEYFPTNIIGGMQQQQQQQHQPQLPSESNNISRLPSVCNAGAIESIQAPFINDVITTQEGCAIPGSIMSMSSCGANQQYQSSALHASSMPVSNIVQTGSSSGSDIELSSQETQVPIDGSVFCPMLNGSLQQQVTPVSSNNVDGSNAICQIGGRTQHGRAQPSSVDNAISDLVLCSNQTTAVHEIGNGQYDRGPGDPSRPETQVAICTSSGNIDQCFSMSSGASSSRSDHYTQSARPLQQIQISGAPSTTECNYSADSGPDVSFCQQNLQRPSVSNVGEQLSYPSGSALVTSPSCSSARSNNLPQLGDLAIKLENCDMVSCTKSNSDEHTCELCGKSGFSTKGNLKRHRKAHAGEKPYKCEHCESKFTEKKSLKIHLRRHTGEKPYKCTVCEKPFSQTGVLKSHMALHLEERKFNCDKCSKAFRQRSQLKLHLMRHDGIKKLECERCMAKFLTKGDLERHFRIHTGERPYKCNMCDKTFTRQQSLNEHKNRHIGRKPFTCKYCDKSFSEMSASYKHAKVHKKEEQARVTERADS